MVDGLYHWWFTKNAGLFVGEPPTTTRYDADHRTNWGFKKAI